MVATFSRIAADALTTEVAAYYDQVEQERGLSHAADYYQHEGPVKVAPQLSRRWGELLGIEAGQSADRDAMLRFLSGTSASGERILPPRAQYLAYDLTFSASKELGIHWAGEENAGRRAIYEAAHRGAVRDVMRKVERRLGWTRRGAGSAEDVPGEIAWLMCQHYTSRPDAPDGQPDPNLHSHVLIRNAVLTADGHVGALDSMRLNGIVHELGALYHMRIAARLADAGIETCLDRNGIAAAIANTPAEAVELFSKRDAQIVAAAHAYAESQGYDWSELTEAHKTGFLRAAKLASRQAKGEGSVGFAAWREALAEAGITLADPIGRVPPPDRSPEARQARAVQAWSAAARTLGAAFEKEAVLDETVLRTHAARALIPLGGGTVADVNAVAGELERRGVILHGEATPLIRGPENGRLRYTTRAQLDTEASVVELARAAAADTRGGLRRDELGTGRLSPEQERMAVALSTGGRLALGIGAAGTGKTTLLAPVVAAYRARGCEVLGIATAWRQATALRGTGIEDAEPGTLAVTEAALRDPGLAQGRQRRRGRQLPRDENLDDARALRDQGIDERRIFATAALLASCEKGRLRLDERSVVIIDEVSQLGVRDAYRLLRMQAATGCRILGIGDDKQCQAVSAGDVIDLFRRAMPGKLPELLESIRQLSDRQKEITRLFREGTPAAVETALRMKIEDGALELVPGDAEAVHRAAARTWAKMADEAARHEWSFGLSAPTHEHARGASAAIRQVRRERGEITGPERRVECIDRKGDHYDLHLAVGDRVRLFDKVRGQALDGEGRRLPGPSYLAGVNGDVVQIAGFTARGFSIECCGRHVEVTLASLRDEGTGRVRLSAGEVHTIDAGQGADGHLWHSVLADGAAIGARRGYVSESRQRVRTHTTISLDAERQAIARERGLGSRAEITDDDVIRHMARALARPSEKTSALAFVEAMEALREPAQELAMQQRRKACIEHGRVLDRAALQPPSERAAAQVLARAVSPAFGQVKARLAETTRAMRAAYGELLDATRLRHGIAAAAAHIEQHKMSLGPGQPRF